MNKRNWTKGTLLALVTTALSTGCGSDPGSASSQVDEGNADPTTGEAEGEMGFISPIGSTTTLGCTAQQLFDVSSLNQAIGWIAVDSGDWAGANMTMQLFSVDEAGTLTRIDTAAQSLLHTQDHITTAHQAASQHAAAAHTEDVAQRSGATTFASRTSRAVVNATSADTVTQRVDQVNTASRTDAATTNAAATHQAAADASQVSTADQASAASANRAAASEAAQSQNAQQIAAAQSAAQQSGSNFASQSTFSPTLVWPWALDGSVFGSIAQSVANMVSQQASQSAAASANAAAAQSAAARADQAQRTSAAATNATSVREASADTAHQDAAAQSAATQSSHLASVQAARSVDHADTATADVARTATTAFNQSHIATTDLADTASVVDSAAEDAATIADQATSSASTQQAQSIMNRTQAFTDLETLQSKHLVLQLNFNGSTAATNSQVAVGSASQTFATGLFPLVFTPCVDP